MTAQLPGPMAADDFLVRFVSILETISDPLYDRANGLDSLVDAFVAPDEMVPWLTGWLGIVIDEHATPARNRAVLDAARRTYPRRGTAPAIAAVVSAMTGGTCEVEDPGAVTRLDRPAPGEVVVTVDTLGTTGRATVEAFLDHEVPAHLPFRLVVRGS